MFSDASAGASQFFTYEFVKHAPNMQRYIHLLTGKPGETEVAVYCPTTLYRLGASLKPTIDAGYPLRDLCEFDVLDEILITDGALTQKRYKALVVFQADIVDEPILKKFDSYLRAGGKIIQVGSTQIASVEGKSWEPSRRLAQVSSLETKGRTWLKELATQLNGFKGVDGRLDKLWTCRRGKELFVFNSSDKPVETRLNGGSVAIAPYTIWFNAKAGTPISRSAR
jgi:hypothetical protein